MSTESPFQRPELTGRPNSNSAKNLNHGSSSTDRSEGWRDWGRKEEVTEEGWEGRRG